MINDFLDNLAAEQYQKMHKKEKDDKKSKYLAQPVDDFWKNSDDETK